MPNTWGGLEWLLILAVVLLLFGGKKLPGLARSLGSGISEFKKGLGGRAKEEMESIKEEIDSEPVHEVQPLRYQLPEAEARVATPRQGAQGAKKKIAVKTKTASKAKSVSSKASSKTAGKKSAPKTASKTSAKPVTKNKNTKSKKK